MPAVSRRYKIERMGQGRSWLVALLALGGCYDPQPRHETLTVERIAGAWAPADLTARGTLDWTHWGLDSVTSLNRKDIPTPQVSDYILLGAGSVIQWIYLPTSFSWEDGTPTAVASEVMSAIFVDSQAQSGDGFRLEVAADTTSRALELYASCWCARCGLVASFSDASAPAASDTSFDVPVGIDFRYSVFLLHFQAAASGQTLIIDYTITDNHCLSGDFGEIFLGAVTLRAE